MSTNLWTHNLSFVLRFNNHFTGDAIPDEFEVRLDETFTRPVLRSDGNGTRQTDGTYRFINIRGGGHRVLWRAPFSLSAKGWVSWDGPLDITLPVSNSAAVVEWDLWPSATARVAPSVTAIRGKLRGNSVNELEVRVSPVASPQSYFTRTDEQGEFLFLLPQPVAPNLLGQLDLQIEVENGSRTVSGGEFHPAQSGSAFVGTNFQMRPGGCSRIIFQIT